MTRSLIHSHHTVAPIRFSINVLQTYLVQILETWQARRLRRAELCHLLMMGPNLIADMGMTVEDAEAEAGLPFWKPAAAPESNLF